MFVDGVLLDGFTWIADDQYNDPGYSSDEDFDIGVMRVRQKDKQAYFVHEG